MSKNKLKGRTICPRCGKGFDNRTEGVLFVGGAVYCTDCYHEMNEEIKHNFGAQYKTYIPFKHPVVKELPVGFDFETQGLPLGFGEPESQMNL